MFDPTKENKPQKWEELQRILRTVRPVKTAFLYHLAQRELLSTEALEESLRISKVIPDRKGWQDFISKTFLLLGITLLLCGIIFFFAYNWASLHKFAKLAITQTILFTFAAVAMIKGFDHIVGKSSLLGACVMIGPTLGVYGTIYQTGADTYELFLGWSVLMAGWVAISKFAGLWFTWFVLINISVFLYCEQVYGRTFLLKEDFYLVFFTINFTAVALWEYFYHKKIEWLQNRFFPRAINILIYSILLPPIIVVIFDSKGLSLVPVIYIFYVAGVFWFYQKQIRDLFMLTINCLSLIVVFSCMFGNEVVDGPGTMIPMSLFIMGITATAGYWLNKVGKAWNN
ncbi:DUF2157 domain-containing protein [Candidatus Uabimicrobium sp. HlEnr_7]|uniref:DUF2157 domain-containing protein n=1 Tax=Candidatus Uabimicrobium helgolandensis TaxID=3095367 RepID=UPI00355734F2